MFDIGSTVLSYGRSTTYNVHIHVVTNVFVHSPALTLLFTSDIEAELTANLYDATEVGFTFDLSPTPNGMTFSLGGLSNHDNTMTILKTMLESEYAVRESFSHSFLPPQRC